MTTPRILILDIETFPNQGYFWDLWHEVRSTEFIENYWYIFCWCAKWLREKEVFSSALPDFSKEYSKDSENDKFILEKLGKLLDECDVVIAHNAKKFDLKKIRTRFIYHGLKVPSPYRVIDTLEIARNNFSFPSNRLDALGEFLGVGRKVKHGGFKELWLKCAKGDLKAWEKMVKYCKGDVTLLEKVYKKLLPYITNHPNVGTYIDDDKPRCKNCGSKELFKQGFQYTNCGKYQQYSCKKCGSWMKGRKNLLLNKPQIN